MKKYNKNFCKEYVQKRKDILKDKIAKLENKPTLCIIQIGDSFASNKYVSGKIKDSEEVGIVTTLLKFNEDIKEEELLQEIYSANEMYNGLIVQLPLPKHISVKKIQKAIKYDVDVDGFNSGSPFYPCTPLGILNLLNEVCDLNGKNVVILGRSDIVGRPMANLLIKKSNATVTICNSYTKNIENYTKKADVLISAIGKPKFITADMIKKDVIIIDVGINQDKNGKMCGDVDYVTVEPLSEFITPVPGGIGLITRLTLLENTYNSYNRKSDVF